MNPRDQALSRPGPSARPRVLLVGGILPLPERASSIVRTGGVIALLLGVTGLVYRMTLASSFGSYDSAELIAAAHSLGIIHSPGYPLYLLIAHAATRLPWGTPAFNVNALSAVFAASAVVVAFAACLRLTGSRWSAGLAAAALAFSRLFWAQAVVAEVYSLSALFTAALILAALRWQESPTARRLFWLALLFGLSLTHHPVVALLGPGLLWVVISGLPRSDARWRHAPALALTACAPLLLYLYLPVRAVADPPLDYVRDYFSVDLASPSGLLWMISGGMFSGELFGRGLGAGLANLLDLAAHLWLNLFGAGLLLALYGLWALRRDRAPTAFFGGSAAGILIFLAFYDVMDNAQMLSPVLVVLTPPMALGLLRFTRRVGGHAAVGITVRRLAAAGIVALLLAANWGFADRRDDWQADRFARMVMARVELNALILAQWTSATPLTYLQVVEGDRPDVRILDRGLLALGIRHRLEQEGRNTPDEWGAAFAAELEGRVHEALMSRPVYVMEDDPTVRASFCLHPMAGGIYRVLAP